MSYKLAIDTSTKFVYLGLSKNNHEVCSLQNESENSHLEELPKLINVILNEHSIKIADLEKIVLGSGPGSFTGLRIAYSFVAGLKFNRELQIQTFSSLLAGGIQYASDNMLLINLIKTRRGAFLVNLFHNNKIVFFDQLLEEEALKKKIDQYATLHEVSEIVHVASQHVLSDYSYRQTLNLASGLLTLSNNFQSDDFAEFPNYILPVSAVKAIKSLT